jgi:hypothetical protein
VVFPVCIAVAPFFDSGLYAPHRGYRRAGGDRCHHHHFSALERRVQRKALQMTELDVRARFDAALPDEYEWDEREATLLAIAERQSARIEQLEALLDDQGLSVKGSTGQDRLNPLVAELRLQYSALARTVEGIRLPDETSETKKSVRHQRAAARRWSAA